MKLLELHEHLTSYRYPIIKIVICLMIISFLITRNHYLHISNQIANIIVTVLSFILGIIAILILYISIAEIAETRWNHHKSVECEDESEIFTTKEIIKAISENDIIDIKVNSDDGIYNIGVSADIKPAGVEFYDKRYYIDNAEFSTMEALSRALRARFPNDEVFVISIDGVLPKFTKYTHF